MASNLAFLKSKYTIINIQKTKAHTAIFSFTAERTGICEIYANALNF